MAFPASLPRVCAASFPPPIKRTHPPRTRRGRAAVHVPHPDADDAELLDSLADGCPRQAARAALRALAKGGAA